MKYTVIDTNVFVSALLSETTAPRQVIRLCLLGEIQPLMSNALFVEFESLLSRDNIFRKSPLSEQQRQDFLSDFLSVCKWVSIYYLWRPNLRDEADNHLIELALSGGGEHIITGNTKDFKGTELSFPQIQILTPSNYLKQRGL